MSLFDKISEDIKNAMKAKDKVALETLRNVKKVFLEAKTAPGANDTLTDDAALKIIQKLAKQGKDTKISNKIIPVQSGIILCIAALRQHTTSTCLVHKNVLKYLC